MAVSLDPPQLVEQFQRRERLGMEVRAMNYRDMIVGERAAFERAPMSELRTIRVALAVHSWGNTLQEKARAEAVEQIIHARLRERV
jgi:hypothetical protein